VRTGGAFTGRSRPAILRLQALLGAALVSFALGACGNASDPPSGNEAPNNLITRAEVDKAGKGSVDQAFLEYWSALQFQAWPEAASYFAPGFRKLIGSAAIIGAKRLNGANYPNLKPKIVGITSHDDLTTLRYYVWLSEGTKELGAATWRKVGGNWQMIDESRLNAELNQFGVNEVEIKRTGVLPTDVSEISPEAAQAGYELSQRQAEYAAQQLDGE
jgi:hypothetical protein